MTEKKPKKKTVFKEEGKCPHCNKLFEIEMTRELENEPVKPEYKERIVVRKSTQTKLK